MLHQSVATDLTPRQHSWSSLLLIAHWIISSKVTAECSYSICSMKPKGRISRWVCLVINLSFNVLCNELPWHRMARVILYQQPVSGLCWQQASVLTWICFYTPITFLASVSSCYSHKRCAGFRFSELHYVYQLVLTSSSCLFFFLISSFLSRTHSWSPNYICF